MTKDCPSLSASLSPSTRLMISGLPPAAVPTTILIGRAGHSCARTGIARKVAADPAKRSSARLVNRMIPPSFRLDTRFLHHLAPADHLRSHALAGRLRIPVGRRHAL